MVSCIYFPSNVWCISLALSCINAPVSLVSVPCFILHYWHCCVVVYLPLMWTELYTIYSGHCGVVKQWWLCCHCSSLKVSAHSWNLWHLWVHIGTCLLHHTVIDGAMSWSSMVIWVLDWSMHFSSPVLPFVLCLLGQPLDECMYWVNDCSLCDEIFLCFRGKNLYHL